MTRIYHQTDSLIYKNIQQNSFVRLVFLSGLGTPIRQQREGFFRRFALMQGISYLALDYTKYALQHKRRDLFQIESFFETTKKILAQCPEEKFLFFGACFGGLMGLKMAQEMPQKISGLVLTSPALEMPALPWLDKADTFLHQKFNEKTKGKKVSFDNLKRLATLHQLFMSIAPVARSSMAHTYRGPMTIFHGEKDPLIPVQNSFQIQLAMQNPNAQLKIVPNMKHTLAFDKEMKLPLNILKQYLGNIKSPL
ncbi:MAG: alpha/beta fold hydrolase [Alphaproteobacteria bacterium]